MLISVPAGALGCLLGLALALNFIAGIYPAYAAARLDPVEAIASE